MSSTKNLPTGNQRSGLERELSRAVLQRVLGASGRLIGAEVAFSSISQGEDNQQQALACHEVYLALLSNGVDVDLDAFVRVFLGLDEDGISLLDEKTLVRPVNDERSRHQMIQNHAKVIKELPSSVRFWIAVALFIAGILFTVGAYNEIIGISSEVAQNLSLGGSVLYILTLAYDTINAWRQARISFARLEPSRLRFKSGIYEQAKRDIKDDSENAAQQEEQPTRMPDRLWGRHRWGRNKKGRGPPKDPIPGVEMSREESQKEVVGPLHGCQQSAIAGILVDYSASHRQTPPEEDYFNQVL